MKEEHISDLMLERYLLKELPEKQIMYIDKLCEQSPDLKSRIDSLKNSNEEILNVYPDDLIVPEIRRTYKTQKQEIKNNTSFHIPFHKRIVLPSIALATAVISLFFIFPVIRTSLNFIATDYSRDTIRIKGNDSEIYIYRKINNTIEVLQNDSIAKTGDLLQIAYVSAKDKYGIILSIDGRGTTTLHYPSDAAGSTKLTTAKKILLPNSYELDDAPDFERFFFITSKHELDVNSIYQSAQLLAKDNENVSKEIIQISDKDDSIQQTSILIKKVK